MTIQSVRSVGGGKLPSGVKEYIDGHKEASVATGDQHFAVTLSKGTYRAIKEVYIYIAGAGAAALFEVARGTTGTHVDMCTSVKYNTTTFVAFDDTNFSNTGLVIMVNTGAGGSVDVYVTIKYYYK